MPLPLGETLSCFPLSPLTACVVYLHSVTRRLFCKAYKGSTHHRFLIAIDTDTGNEVGRLSNETVAAGCHADGDPICINGRLLMFGDGERYFQVYDCATLHELYAGPNPAPGAPYAHKDAVNAAKLVNGELFTVCTQYARRWDLHGVVATPADKVKYSPLILPSPVASPKSLC